MVKNDKEEQKNAMVVLASYYLKDVLDNKSGSKICITINPFCKELDQISDALAELSVNPLSHKILNNTCAVILEFISRYSFYEYHKLVVNNFRFIAPNQEYLPTLMILDYFYTDKMGFVQGVNYDEDEPKAVTIPYFWADYLLICYYIGKKDEKGKNGVSEYVHKRANSTPLSQMSVQDYIEILVKGIIVYRGSLANKVSILQNKKMQSNFEDFSKVISDNYAVKLKTTSVLSNFITDIAKTKKLIPQKNISGVTDFKMGNCVFKNVKLTHIEDGCIELSYMVNGVERFMFINPDVPGSVVNYFVYTDMIALILALRHTSVFEQEDVSKIVQKYNLLYVRSIDLEPDTYSDFLSLFSND